AIYTEERLQRGDLLEKYPWLMELVAAHDTECPLFRVAELAENRAAGDPSASARLSELVGYDAAFRTLAVEKGRLNPELLPFLLGRSLGDILKSQFGIQILFRDQAFSSS
ncbi:MAG: hypothetical protein RBT16_12325, partial [Desulfococcus multivorans]|nr:hypothetical protein [Desulfococcus multivorans]